MNEYKKYRWFYTSEGTLVIGGKNAVQNDELLTSLVRKKDYVVMHSSDPGSPFAVIIKEISKVTAHELEECAVFTGCFSRAWRERKKKTSVDIFTLGQLSKNNLKAGMWQVQGKVERKDVMLKLALVKQKGVLRAVPPMTTKKPLMQIVPGTIDKKDMTPQFEVELAMNISQEELMAALPAGGVKKA
jgi:hypothetical protein